MFEINGVVIQSPKRHGWNKRSSLGVNGEGNPIYSNYRSYQMQWPIMLPSEYNKLQTGFTQCAASGTCTLQVPYYVSGAYTFEDYSAVAYEPSFQSYFNETYRNIKMIFTKITA